MSRHGEAGVPIRCRSRLLDTSIAILSSTQPGQGPIGGFFKPTAAMAFPESSAQAQLYSLQTRASARVSAPRRRWFRRHAVEGGALVLIGDMVPVGPERIVGEGLRHHDLKFVAYEIPCRFGQVQSFEGLGDVYSLEEFVGFDSHGLRPPRSCRTGRTWPPPGKKFALSPLECPSAGGRAPRTDQD